MTLVSKSHRFIYLKTFKTGGTSTEMALQTLCTPAGTTIEHFGPAIISENGIVGCRGEKHCADDTSGWTSHMSARDVADNLESGDWDAYTKVASIRNPFDKAVSWYWFARARGKTSAGNGEIDSVADFRAFLKDQEASGKFKSNLDIDWRVTHLDDQLIIDHWVRLEHLDVDLDALYLTLGSARPVLDVPRAKSKSRVRDRLPVQAYFDNATADIIRRNQEWIFEVGGYSFSPMDAGRASKKNHGAKRGLVGRILKFIRRG